MTSNYLKHQAELTEIKKDMVVISELLDKLLIKVNEQSEQIDKLISSTSQPNHLDPDYYPEKLP